MDNYGNTSKNIFDLFLSYIKDLVNESQILEKMNNAKTDRINDFVNNIVNNLSVSVIDLLYMTHDTALNGDSMLSILPINLAGSVNEKHKFNLNMVCNVIRGSEKENLFIQNNGFYPVYITKRVNKREFNFDVISRIVDTLPNEICERLEQYRANDETTTIDASRQYCNWKENSKILLYDRTNNKKMVGFVVAHIVNNIANNMLRYSDSEYIQKTILGTRTLLRYMIFYYFGETNTTNLSKRSEVIGIQDGETLLKLFIQCAEYLRYIVAIFDRLYIYLPYAESYRTLKILNENYNLHKRKYPETDICGIGVESTEYLNKIYGLGNVDRMIKWDNETINSYLDSIIDNDNTYLGNIFNLYIKNYGYNNLQKLIK